MRSGRLFCERRLVAFLLLLVRARHDMPWKARRVRRLAPELRMLSRRLRCEGKLVAFGFWLVSARCATVETQYRYACEDDGQHHDDYRIGNVVVRIACRPLATEGRRRSGAHISALTCEVEADAGVDQPQKHDTRPEISMYRAGNRGPSCPLPHLVMNGAENELQK